MKRISVHIAVFCALGGPAMAQHITSNVAGVDDTRHFYQVCLQTAPTFLDAERRKTRDYIVTVGQASAEAEPPGRIRGRYDSLRLIEADGTCSCSMTFELAESRLADFQNNFSVTLQREFGAAFRSSGQKPTEMTFEFKGVTTEVTMPVARYSENVVRVRPQAMRMGACPA